MTEVARQGKYSCKGSTIDPREAELAAKMLIDGIAENLRNGFIVLASLR